MQHDGQLRMMVDTSDIAGTLALIADHGAASATLSITRRGDHAILDLLLPRQVDGAHALRMARELASQPACHSVEVHAIRRMREGQTGAGYALTQLGGFAPAPWRAAA